MSNNPKHVLLVEDDPELCHVLAMLVRAEGYKVTEARDALYALSESLKIHPDLIILDLGLPGGGGMHALENLRNIHHSEAEVIVFTGCASVDDVVRARELGVSSFLLKSTDTHKLVAEVKRLVGPAVVAQVEAPAAPAREEAKEEPEGGAAKASRE